VFGQTVHHSTIVKPHPNPLRPGGAARIDDGTDVEVQRVGAQVLPNAAERIRSQRNPAAWHEASRLGSAGAAHVFGILRDARYTFTPSRT